jgi:hypothetical protein
MMNIQTETQQTQITNNIIFCAIKGTILFIIMHKSRIKHLFFFIENQKPQFDQNVFGQSKKP